MTRVLVCGGRAFFDRRLLEAKLDYIHERFAISLLIEGGADGVDSLARRWAITRNVPFKTFRADWNQYGKSAGPRRNLQMLDEGKPDFVVAFPGGKGTSNMIKLSEDRSIKVLKIDD